MNYLTQQPINMDTWNTVMYDGTDGAGVTFSGVVRRMEKGEAIEGLYYEAYASMAEKTLHRLVDEAKRRWSLSHVQIQHRIGWIPVGEASVFIGVQSPHRKEAFEACRYLIDTIKVEVPIWKKCGNTYVACQHAE